MTTIVAKLKAKGLKLGVYDSPFWYHYTNPNAVIPGTDGIKVSSLAYDPAKDKDIKHPGSKDQFGWVVTDHPGAEQYFEGFFKHYSDLGVKFVRMDFLSWYEDGMNYTDVIDKGYGRERYVKGMQWINKYAQKYGVYVSLVMPHLRNNALIERYAGNMVRIDADALEGSWYVSLITTVVAFVVDGQTQRMPLMVSSIGQRFLVVRRFVLMATSFVSEAMLMIMRRCL